MSKNNAAKLALTNAVNRCIRAGAPVYKSQPAKWAIYDWAGNHLWKHGEFSSFYDAWDYILGEMTDKLGLTEEDYGEYYVEQKR